MIFPFLSGVLSFRAIPITWLLVFLSSAVTLTSQISTGGDVQMTERLLSDEYFLNTQGQVYAQFVEQNSLGHSQLLQELATSVLAGNLEKTKVMGTLALRDQEFLDQSQILPFQGDQVAIRNWREQMKKLLMHQENHPSFFLGLNAQDMGVRRWLSYIFVHSGPVHCFGNMIFLLLFGSVLEPLIGGLAVLVTFLLSGMIAAGVFLLITGVSSAPLVGASGAVSGLMALFCFFYWHKPVRFVYWLMIPMRGFMGFVFLPAWILFALWLSSDLAGYLGSVHEFGGVAYAAHLGGEAAGLIVGLTVMYLRLWRQQQPVEAKIEATNQPVGVAFPFIEPPRSSRVRAS